MQFVNIHGQTIDTEQALKDAKKTYPSSKVAPLRDPKWMGWRVCGFHPAAIAQAEAEHDAGDPIDGSIAMPFDARMWMHNRKAPQIGRLYQIEDAADTFAALARREGYLGVTIEEVIR